MAHQQWPPWEVTSSLNNLHQLRELVERPKEAAVTSEALGWLSRLLVVRSCGYLEQAVAFCGRGYVQAKSGGLVRAFSLTWLTRTRNPSYGALLELAGRFDLGLRDELERTLKADDARLEKDLHALVDRRNRIAHGENEGIGRDRALSLSTSSEALADWWILALKPY